MSDRQWEELDGEPDLLTSKARSYQDIADAIERATRTLDAVSDDITTRSLAMDATRDLATEVSADIRKALTRYRDTGDALAQYADALREAKNEADPAARALRAARAEADEEKHRQWWAQMEVDGLSPDASWQERDAAMRSLSLADQRAAEAGASVTALENQWTRGHESKEVAASRAVGAIAEVVTGTKVGDLKDSAWDVAKNVASSLYDAFKVICDIAGILAVFLAWVPGLGQLLVVLAAVGAILSVVEAAVSWASGEGSFLDLLGATALAVVSVYGGRAVTGVATWVKGRAVLDAAADLGASGAAAKFGSSVLREADAVVGTSRGARVWNIVSSPFRRTASQREAYLAYKSSLSSGWTQGVANVKNAAAEAFPLKGQLSGFAERNVVGNKAVAALVGDQIDGALTLSPGLERLAAAATMSQVGLRAMGATTDTQALGQAIESGDPGQIAEVAGGQILSMFDGEGSSLLSGVTGAFELVDIGRDTDFFGLQSPFEDAVWGSPGGSDE